MMLSCKFAAYFQKMFLQEHHWRGSVQHSELLNFFFLCYRGLCYSLFSGNAPANILYWYKYAEWREMKNYVKFKKTIFSKWFSFLLISFTGIIRSAISSTQTACDTKCVQYVIQWFLHCLQQKIYLFYKEFFGVFTGSQNLTPPPSFHPPPNFIKRESEVG